MSTDLFSHFDLGAAIGPSAQSQFWRILTTPQTADGLRSPLEEMASQFTNFAMNTSEGAQARDIFVRTAMGNLFKGVPSAPRPGGGF